MLDRLFADFTVETTLQQVLLPYLRELGDRWANGAIGVATEHFASNLLRARLASLAQGWGQGRGPCAVLACPPGELHDLPLLVFGVALHRNGWRIVYLGADTPLADLARTVEEKHPDVVILAAIAPRAVPGIHTRPHHPCPDRPPSAGRRRGHRGRRRHRRRHRPRR